MQCRSHYMGLGAQMRTPRARSDKAAHCLYVASFSAGMPSLTSSREALSIYCPPKREMV